MNEKFSLIAEYKIGDNNLKFYLVGGSDANKMYALEYNGGVEYHSSIVKCALSPTIFPWCKLGDGFSVSISELQEKADRLNKKKGGTDLLALSEYYRKIKGFQHSPQQPEKTKKENEPTEASPELKRAATLIKAAYCMGFADGVSDILS